MNFLEKYNQYKKIYTICEGNFNKILPLIQKNYINGLKLTEYKDLNDEQKKDLDSFIEWSKQEIHNAINRITTNPQYQSWIYDRIYDDFLYNVYDPLEFTKDIHKDDLKLFEQICRSPKITKDQKNIFNYKTYDQLHDFVYSFLQNHNSKNMKLPFRKLPYQSKDWDLYAITLQDKKSFQLIYGSFGYNCGWCVVNSDKEMFERYLEDKPNDYYCLWTYKGTNRPFALSHINSNQFKDIHNNPFILSDFNEQQLQFIDKYIVEEFIGGEEKLYSDDYIINDTDELGDFSCFYDRLIKSVFSSERLIYHYLPSCYKTEEGFYNCNTSIYSEQLKNFVEDGHLTIKFKSCESSFCCDDLGLKTLSGVPSIINGSFDCSNNNITNLEFGPRMVINNYFIHDNDSLTSLKGIAYDIGELIIAYCSELTKIDYIPNVVQKIEIHDCSKLTDIKLLTKFVNKNIPIEIADIGISQSEIDQQLQINKNEKEK